MGLDRPLGKRSPSSRHRCRSSVCSPFTLHPNTLPGHPIEAPKYISPIEVQPPFNSLCRNKLHCFTNTTRSPDRPRAGPRTSRLQLITDLGSPDRHRSHDPGSQPPAPTPRGPRPARAPRRTPVRTLVTVVQTEYRTEVREGHEHRSIGRVEPPRRGLGEIGVVRRLGVLLGV